MTSFREYDVIGNYRGSQPNPQIGFSVGLVRLFDSGVLVGSFTDVKYQNIHEQGRSFIALGEYKKDSYMKFWKFSGLQNAPSLYLLNHTKDGVFTGTRTDSPVSIESLMRDSEHVADLAHLHYALGMNDDRKKLDKIVNASEETIAYLLCMTDTRIRFVMESYKAMIRLLKK